MKPKQLISQHFAKRINLNQTEMMELIKQVVSTYDLGELKLAQGIEIGYEDVNFSLTTTKGKFLLKVLVDFTAKKPRSKQDSENYVDTMEKLRANGVPVPKLFKTGQDFLLKQVVPHNDEPIYMLVMEFFEGEDFIKNPPSIEDIKVIAKILSRINNSQLKREPMYDPWQPHFILEEYQENKHLLSKTTQNLIDEIANKVKQINFDQLPKAPIHADFMRNNLLKNDQGEYCVLDFGVVNYAPRITDLAVFLAGFCLDPDINLKENILAYQAGLTEYQKHVALSKEEKEHIGTMVRASYAIFHIAASHEKFVENNLTEENEYWIKLGLKGLQLTKKMKL